MKSRVTRTQTIFRNVAFKWDIKIGTRRTHWRKVNPCEKALTNVRFVMIAYVLAYKLTVRTNLPFRCILLQLEELEDPRMTLVIHRSSEISLTARLTDRLMINTILNYLKFISRNVAKKFNSLQCILSFLSKKERIAQCWVENRKNCYNTYSVGWFYVLGIAMLPRTARLLLPRVDIYTMKYKERSQGTIAYEADEADGRIIQWQVEVAFEPPFLEFW